MINFALEMQAKSNDELVRRLIEERDRKKIIDSNVNPSSSYAVNFAQTNPQTSDTSAGGTTMSTLLLLTLLISLKPIHK
jgi:hypothetical protein